MLLTLWLKALFLSLPLCTFYPHALYLLFPTLIWINKEHFSPHFWLLCIVPLACDNLVENAGRGRAKVGQADVGPPNLAAAGGQPVSERRLVPCPCPLSQSHCPPSPGWGLPSKYLDVTCLHCDVCEVILGDGCQEWVSKHLPESEQII